MMPIKIILFFLIQFKFRLICLHIICLSAQNALSQLFVLWRPRVICQSNCLRTVEICRIIDKVYWVHSCVSPTTHRLPLSLGLYHSLCLSACLYACNASLPDVHARIRNDEQEKSQLIRQGLANTTTIAQPSFVKTCQLFRAMNKPTQFETRPHTLRQHACANCGVWDVYIIHTHIIFS